MTDSFSIVSVMNETLTLSINITIMNDYVHYVDMFGYNLLNIHISVILTGRFLHAHVSRRFGARDELKGWERLNQ